MRQEPRAWRVAVEGTYLYSNLGIYRNQFPEVVVLNTYLKGINLAGALGSVLARIFLKKATAQVKCTCT